MHPIETRLAAAEDAVGASPGTAPAAARFDLARAAWEAGRPSVAEPVLRGLVEDPEVGMTSSRLLAEILVATARPAEAARAAAQLDGSGSSLVIKMWLRAIDGDPAAGTEALAALDAMSAPTIVDRRLAHQAAAMSPANGAQAALFAWTSWLRDNADEDPDTIEHIEAWISVLEIAVSLQARLDQLHGLPVLLLSLALPLPHGHPVQARAFIAAATALAGTSPEMSVVLVDHVARHVGEIDALLREDIEQRTVDLAGLVGLPSSTLVAPGLRAIALGSRAGFGLAQDLDDRNLDLYVCLMKTATARDFLRAIASPAANWTGESVGLSLRPAPDGDSVELTFAAVHPDSEDLRVYLRAPEINAVVTFAQAHGIAPAFAAAAGRNDSCPCGSGLKYKRCCGA